MHIKNNIAIFKWLLSIGLLISLCACQSLPSLANRNVDFHISSTTPSTLSYANAPLIATHPQLSGVYPLDDAQEALAARIALVKLAEHSLDLQYYIWRNDTSGELLFHELVKAANRGVHIRLLLDDNNTVGMDKLLQIINNVPNIQVRLFNPFIHRKWRIFSYITDFKRINHRMHNKSMIADNQIAIVGGRNIGDEYFDMGSGILFVDLDVLSIGPIVEDVSDDFDRYWNSNSSYPFNTLFNHKTNKIKQFKLDNSEQIFKQLHNKADNHSNSLKDFLFKLKNGTLEYQWAKTELISDDPAKATPKSKKAIKQENRLHKTHSSAAMTNSQLALNNLMQTMPVPKKNMLLISPYFVPTKVGVGYLSALSHQGVHIKVLTNSLSATDVPIVHSGYARYRKTLLYHGIELYELKNQQQTKGKRDQGITGNSASSLHAKTFTIDNQYLFVGSLNLDPRSAKLNTEMGVLIQSPELVKYMNKAVNESLPYITYKVSLTPKNQLKWQNLSSSETEEINDHEPQTSIWRRGWVKLWSYFPIENLL